VSHPERIIPDETASGVVALHLERYVFAARYCREKRVLDAGCGVGYGSGYLGGIASSVTGVDIDGDAVEYASGRYGSERVEFRRMDVADLEFEDAAFDVVVSFETIEHLPDRETYLREVARVLRPDGAYVVSTPQAPRTTHSPANPFHHVEYDRGDFEQLLRAHFDEVELYGQRRRQTARHRLLRRLDVLGLRRRIPALRRASFLTGSPATEHVSPADVVIERGRLEDATELVAVCRGPRPS
jgi:SAM-dependent methyltransferase